MFLFFCFFLFVTVFFTIPVVKENARVNMALATPAGASIKLTKEIIGTPPIVADKTIKAWSL